MNLKTITKKISRINYILRSKKISSALKKIIEKPIIGIVDIGAGHRYLPILLNFDGVAKIAMVDPNKSLDWSFNNFKKIIKHPENLHKFKFGISNKTSKKKYYVLNTMTGSTFVNVYKTAKKNKEKLGQVYFGNKSTSIQQVYSFKDFIKKFFKFEIDIVKIDVEGLEDKIIPSVVKNSSPLLIEVETNLNSDIYPNSFDKINTILKQKNYKMLTGFPVYKNTKNLTSKNLSFGLGNYDNPILRSPLEQFECIYVKDKNIYNVKEISILLGYGLLHEVEKIIKLSKLKVIKSKKNLIQDFMNKFF